MFLNCFMIITLVRLYKFGVHFTYLAFNDPFRSRPPECALVHLHGVLTYTYVASCILPQKLSLFNISKDKAFIKIFINFPLQSIFLE